MGGRVVVSVVIPVWQEEPAALAALYARLTGVLERLAMPWEAILVEDGSPRATHQAVRELVAHDGRVRVLRLARRSGQEAAVVAGLLEAAGELICTMDCDLEDAPEELPRILTPLRHGADLVLGRRKALSAPSARRAASWLFNQTMSLRWGVRVTDWGCNFNAGRRWVFEPLRGRLERWRDGPLKLGFLRQARHWVEVEVRRAPRAVGRSGYSWWRLGRLGLRALTRGSRVTLRRPHRVVGGAIRPSWRAVA